MTYKKSVLVQGLRRVLSVHPSHTCGRPTRYALWDFFAHPHFVRVPGLSHIHASSAWAPVCTATRRARTSRHPTQILACSGHPLLNTLLRQGLTGLVLAMFLIQGLVMWVPGVHAEEPRDNITLKVTTVNPSKTKTQVVPVKIDLPKEVTSREVVDLGGLNLEYDSSRGIYYVFSNNVELKPLETRVFAIEIEDVWFIPDDRLKDLAGRAQNALKFLEGSERYEEADVIAQRIMESIDDIAASQMDDTVSRETHIGIYRTNLELMEVLKGDVEAMERMLVSTPGPPIPEIVDEMEVTKTEAPSQAVTWIVIFIIIIFIGLLSGIFFFTWHRQERITQSYLSGSTDAVFQPPSEQKEQKEKEPGS